MSTPRIPLLPGLPGDKLVAPLNAPAAGQAAAGVQPGVSSGIVLAQYVIVFGTTGGVFIYAGTPAFGNPPLYWMGNVTADPYGNAVEPGIWAGTASGAQVGIQVNSNAGEILFPLPGTFSGDARIGSLNFGSGAALEIIGPSDMAPANDSVLLDLVDNAGGSGSAAWFLGYNDANGGSNTHAVGNYKGMQIFVAQPITATAPGSGTSPTNPATVESWHAMTLTNSWANVAGFAAAKYRLIASPPNTVEIIGAINAAAASSASFFTLPAAYRPASNVPVCSMGANASVPAGLSPWIECTTAGVLSVQNTGALGAWESFFHGYIALDA